MNKALRKRGFTLVELILVIGMIAIIGIATVGMLHDSHAIWKMSSKRSTLLQDSQAAMEQMLRILRQAKSFDTISASTEEAGSVVFTDVDNITTQFSRDAVDDELDYGEPGDLNALAGGVSSLVFTCYDIDGAALSDPVDVGDIKSVEVNATFTDPDDSSISFALSGRIFCATDSYQGIIARWALNETSGFTAADIAGGNDGTLTNMNGNEWIGGALEFDGTNDHVADDDGEDYINGLTAFTISMWIQSDLTGTDKGFIIGKDPTGNDNVFSLRYDAVGGAGGGTNVIKAGVTVSGIGQQLESSNNAQTTGWQHLALTWSSGNQLALYIDGSIDSPTYNNAAQTGSISGSDTLLIGRGAKDSGGTDGWDGRIDDIRIYNCALDSAEIAELADILRYRQFTEAKTGSDTTSLTISTPGDTSEGDLLIAAVATDGDTSGSLAPPGGEGWTEIDINDYSSAVTLGAWWKNADASESGTHQFTWTGDQSAYGWMMRFTGHDSSDPIGDNTGSGSTGSSPSSPAVTTAGDYSLVLRLGAFDDGDITIDSPGLSGHEPITMDSSVSSGIVTIESTTISKGTADEEFDMSMPATRPDGDLYLAQIAQAADATFRTIPSGWTEITDRVSDGHVRFSSYWKIGSSEPATYTWESNDDDDWIGAIHRISGINTSNPINASDDRTGDSSSPTAPSVTTSVDNCLIFRMYGAEIDEQALSYWPGGTTPIFQDNKGDAISAAAYEYEVSAGSTGTGAFSMNRDEEWVAATIAIAPGGGADGVSGGAGWLSQSSSGSSGTSAFSLTASQEARLLTIEITPDPDGGSQ